MEPLSTIDRWFRRRYAVNKFNIAIHDQPSTVVLERDMQCYNELNVRFQVQMPFLDLRCLNHNQMRNLTIKKFDLFIEKG